MIRKKIYILICIVLLIGCENNCYELLIKKAKNYNWHNNMLDAEKALKITKKAIKNEPHRWDAYSLELQIYSTWNHKTKDFSENYRDLKSVYDKWLQNGNVMNNIQKLGYANTLYCLDKIEESNEIFLEIINYYENNQIPLDKNEKEYICYIFSKMMGSNLDKDDFEEIKRDSYNKNGINDFLLNEIENLQKSDRKTFAQRYCVS